MLSFLELTVPENTRSAKLCFGLGLLNLRTLPKIMFHNSYTERKNIYSKKKMKTLNLSDLSNYVWAEHGSVGLGFVSA